MKKSLLLVWPLTLCLVACGSLQPMMGKAGETLDRIFGAPDDGTSAPQADSGTTGTMVRTSYDRAAVECNEEAMRPSANGDFNFCMRVKGWTPVTRTPPVN